MTPEVFAVECDALIDKAMVEVHGLLGDAPRVRVLQTIATGFFNLDPGRIASLAAIALIRLADEQGTHAMTATSFEIAIEAAADENTKLRAQVAGLRQQRNATLAANYALHDEASRSERHRLAWTSARGRAAAYHDEMDDAREERDSLRALVRDLSSDVTALLAERDEAREALREAGQRLAEVHYGT